MNYSYLSVIHCGTWLLASTIYKCYFNLPMFLVNYRLVLIITSETKLEIS